MFKGIYWGLAVFSIILSTQSVPYGKLNHYLQNESKPFEKSTSEAIPVSNNLSPNQASTSGAPYGNVMPIPLTPDSELILAKAKTYPVSNPILQNQSIPEDNVPAAITHPESFLQNETPKEINGDAKPKSQPTPIHKPYPIPKSNPYERHSEESILPIAVPVQISAPHQTPAHTAYPIGKEGSLVFVPKQNPYGKRPDESVLPVPILTHPAHHEQKIINGVSKIKEIHKDAKSTIAHLIHHHGPTPAPTQPHIHPIPYASKTHQNAPVHTQSSSNSGPPTATKLPAVNYEGVIEPSIPIHRSADPRLVSNNPPVQGWKIDNSRMMNHPNDAHRYLLNDPREDLSRFESINTAHYGSNPDRLREWNAINSDPFHSSRSQFFDNPFDGEPIHESDNERLAPYADHSRMSPEEHHNMMSAEEHRNRMSPQNPTRETPKPLMPQWKKDLVNPKKLIACVVNSKTPLLELKSSKYVGYEITYLTVLAELLGLSFETLPVTMDELQKSLLKCDIGAGGFIIDETSVLNFSEPTLKTAMTLITLYKKGTTRFPSNDKPIGVLKHTTQYNEVRQVLVKDEKDMLYQLIHKKFESVYQDSALNDKLVLAMRSAFTIKEMERRDEVSRGFVLDPTSEALNEVINGMIVAISGDASMGYLEWMKTSTTVWA